MHEDAVYVPLIGLEIVKGWVGCPLIQTRHWQLILAGHGQVEKKCSLLQSELSGFHAGCHRDLHGAEPHLPDCARMFSTFVDLRLRTSHQPCSHRWTDI